jgi:hypothetical protein
MTPSQARIAAATPEELILWKLSNGMFTEKHAAVLDSATPFVHYTTADTAMRIIRNKTFWLRNATCMNDYSEVEHGSAKVIEFFGNDATGGKFWEQIDAVHPGLSAAIKKNFDDGLTDLRANTFLGCISEHDAKEDDLGRLSMWRAYGSGAGVALVADPTPMLTVSDAMNAWTYPVLYLDGQELSDMLERIVAAYQDHADYVKTLTRDYLQGMVTEMLHTLAHCLKHPGFAEEREWRIVYRPRRNPSEHIKLELETVRGIPQLVAKMPLSDIPDKGMVGIEPAKLLKRVIIGPTEYGVAMQAAFWEVLKEVGAENIYSKVVVSDIPLRT